MAVIVVLLLVIPFNVSSHVDNNETLDIQIAVSTISGEVTKADIETVKNEFKDAIKFIPQILGVQYRKTLKVNIVDDGICYAENGIIFLPIPHIRDKSAPIIHELTHIIARHENNSFFSEGLAVYFQEKYGNYKNFPNFSISLDDYLKTHKEQLIELSTLQNNNDIFEQIGTEKRRVAYIEAGSFFNYLVEKFGVKKLAALNKSSSLNYSRIYGKTFEELETEWKNVVLEESFNK